MKPEELVCEDLKPQPVGGLMAPHADDAGDFYAKKRLEDMEESYGSDRDEETADD